ncbi:hypothetical protein [Streptomyces sp. NPDC058698]|uniref:hypothetical protein n=1 Tax=Streptomyces sp. NPDC058698 TaxID=3346606 RepID=UPI00365FB358
MGDEPAAGDEFPDAADGLLVAEVGVLLVDGAADLRVRGRGQQGVDAPLVQADCFDVLDQAGEPRSSCAESEDENGPFRKFSYSDLIARDTVNFDITWMNDPALDDADSGLPPEVIAEEIVRDLQSALNEFHRHRPFPWAATWTYRRPTSSSGPLDQPSTAYGRNPAHAAEVKAR